MWVPGRMLGSGLISFFLSHFLSSRTLRPSLRRSGHLVVTPDQFLGVVGHLLPQEPLLNLPRITGRDLQEIARAGSLLLGGWMVGLGVRLKLCLYLGFRLDTGSS